VPLGGHTYNISLALTGGLKTVSATNALLVPLNIVSIINDDGESCPDFVKDVMPSDFYPS